MKKYLRRIDILKIFSCAAVLLYHLGLLKGGYLAVCTFFVLSGYSAVRSLQIKKTVSWKDHYRRRAQRLYLPLLLSVLLSIGLLVFFPQVRWLNLRSETLSVLFGYNNLWQIRAKSDYFARAAASPFVHFWYIAILLQYELLFPFLYVPLKRLGRRSKALPCLLLIILILCSALRFTLLSLDGEITKAYYGTFSRSFAYLGGILLGFTHRYYPLPVVKDQRVCRHGFSLLLAVMTGMFLFCDPEILFAPMMLLATFFSLRLMDHAAAEEAKSTPLLHTIASLTYEIYLLHYPFLYLLASSELPAILQKSLALLLTAVLALLLHALCRPLKRFFLLQLGCTLLLTVAALFGMKSYASAEDYRAEMTSLQEKLEANKKLIEERNREREITLEGEDRMAAYLDSELSDEEIAAEILKTSPVTAIGDSILLDAVDRFYEILPDSYFDCEISRNLYAGEKILQQLKDEGRLGDPLILCLATNGDFSRKRCEELLEITEDRTVFWVNAVGADDPRYNARFAEFAAEHPSIHIVDWEQASKGHPEYFYYDGIHVIGAGVAAFRDTIYQEMLKVTAEEFRQYRSEAAERAETLRREKIGIYGNKALAGLYEYLPDDPKIGIFTADYDFSMLQKELSAKKEAGELEGTVVLLLDQEAGFSAADYRKILEICEGERIILCKLTDSDLSSLSEKAKILDIHHLCEEDPSLLHSDHLHLNEKGNEVLAQLLKEALTNEGS